MISPSRIRVNSAVLFALSLKLTFRLYISTSLVGLVRGSSIGGLLEEFQVTAEENPMPKIPLSLADSGGIAV